MDRGTLKSPRREGVGASKHNPMGLKYIYRLEADWRPGPREHVGWRVKFPESGIKKFSVKSKSFYDHWEGGKKKCLHKAILWRNKMMRKHGYPLTHRRIPVPWMLQSPTGVRGVYKQKERDIYISLFAEDKNVYRRAHFSYHNGKMTKEEALVGAVRFRLEQEKRIYGGIVTKLPAYMEKLMKKIPPSRTPKPTGSTKALYVTRRTRSR